MTSPQDRNRRTIAQLTLLAVVAAVAGCSHATRNEATTDAAVRAQLAQLADKDNDAAGALDQLAAIAAREPDDASAQISYATALADTGRNRQALQVAAPVYDRDKSPTRLGLLVGRLHIRMEQVGPAATVYHEILAHDPDNIDALNGLGIAQVMQGTLGGAETSFRRAVGLAPADPASRNNLALALALEHKTDEAIPELQSLLRDDAGSRRIRSNLALAYAVAGDRDRATATLSPLMSATEAEKTVDLYAREGAAGSGVLAQGVASAPPVPTMRVQPQSVAVAAALPRAP
jgi:Flp pilus assembly protein TadD